MIVNKRIDEAVKTLKCFDSEAVMYWLDRMVLSNSEKGFVMMYLGLCETL